MRPREKGFDDALARHRKGLHRRGDAFEVLRPQGDDVKALTQQPKCLFADDHGVWLGQALQTRRQIGRFTHRQVLTVQGVAHFAHDHEPGMDANAHAQGHRVLRPKSVVQRDHCSRDSKPRMHRPRRVILVGLWVTKIDQQSVSQVLRNVPFKLRNLAPGTVLVGQDDFTQHLRVEVARQVG